jgi:hypothetical protein
VRNRYSIVGEREVNVKKEYTNERMKRRGRNRQNKTLEESSEGKGVERRRSRKKEERGITCEPG